MVGAAQKTADDVDLPWYVTAATDTKMRLAADRRAAEQKKEYEMGEFWLP